MAWQHTGREASARFLPIILPGAAALLTASYSTHNQGKAMPIRCQEVNPEQAPVGSLPKDNKSAQTTSLPPTAFGQAKLRMVQVIFRCRSNQSLVPPSDGSTAVLRDRDCTSR